MKLIILILLFSITVFGDEWIRNPYDQNIFISQRNCSKNCIPLIRNTKEMDMRILAVIIKKDSDGIIRGYLDIDTIKKQQIDQEKIIINQKLNIRRQAIERLKSFDPKSSNLGDAIKDIIDGLL